MVKEPRAGRVKTRLGRELGVIPATWWFRHQIASLLRRIEHPAWDVHLAIAPDNAISSRCFPNRVARIAQGQGDLGRRMMRAASMPGAGPVLIIGADIPGIDAARIRNAFKLLGNHDAVFGPAPDGGYWAIGFARRRPLPRMALTNVRWSSPHALADSIRSLGGCSYALADTLRDVDTIADLAKPLPDHSLSADRPA